MDSARTFFVTTVTAQRRRIFLNDRMARVFIDTLLRYRNEGKFAVHEFVLMPDHFHALVTPSPSVSLEKSMQFIKGGFPFRAKRELEYPFEIWEPSFTNHRIRDAADYGCHVEYIRRNPIKGGLKEPYPYSSVVEALAMDEPPPGLKPISLLAAVSPG